MKSLAIIAHQAFSLINFRGSLISRLREAGVRVYALAPDYDPETRKKVVLLGAEPLDYSLARTGLNPLRDMFDLFALSFILHKLNPDASLVYGIKPVIYGSLASRLAGVPHCYALIEGLGYIFMADEASHSLRRQLLKKLVVFLYRFSCAKITKIFLLNPDDEADLLRARIIKPSQIVRIDGIGLDLDYYQHEPSLPESISFLLVARMLREKGVYDYIEAASLVKKQYPELRFVLVGDVDSNPGAIPEEALKNLCDKHGIDWVGNVSDVRPYLKASSVFVLPSYREGLPRSTQEAMAIGRAVITTDVPGCRETVVEGVNGFLVPVQDPLSLSMAMLRFIENPLLIEKMGRSSREMACLKFDEKLINKIILNKLKFLEASNPS